MALFLRHGYLFRHFYAAEIAGRLRAHCCSDHLAYILKGIDIYGSRGDL